MIFEISAYFLVIFGVPQTSATLQWTCAPADHRNVNITLCKTSAKEGEHVVHRGRLPACVAELIPPSDPVCDIETALCISFAKKNLSMIGRIERLPMKFEVILRNNDSFVFELNPRKDMKKEPSISADYITTNESLFEGTIHAENNTSLYEINHRNDVKEGVDIAEASLMPTYKNLHRDIKESGLLRDFEAPNFPETTSVSSVEIPTTTESDGLSDKEHQGYNLEEGPYSSAIFQTENEEMNSSATANSSGRVDQTTEETSIKVPSESTAEPRVVETESKETGSIYYEIHHGSRIKELSSTTVSPKNTPEEVESTETGGSATIAPVKELEWTCQETFNGNLYHMHCRTTAKLNEQVYYAVNVWDSITKTIPASDSSCDTEKTICPSFQGHTLTIAGRTERLPMTLEVILKCSDRLSYVIEQVSDVKLVPTTNFVESTSESSVKEAKAPKKILEWDCQTLRIGEFDRMQCNTTVQLHDRVHYAVHVWDIITETIPASDSTCDKESTICQSFEGQDFTIDGKINRLPITIQVILRNNDRFVYNILQEMDKTVASSTMNFAKSTTQASVEDSISSASSRPIPFWPDKFLGWACRKEFYNHNANFHCNATVQLDEKVRYIATIRDEITETIPSSYSTCDRAKTICIFFKGRRLTIEGRIDRLPMKIELILRDKARYVYQMYQESDLETESILPNFPKTTPESTVTYAGGSEPTSVQYAQENGSAITEIPYTEAVITDENLEEGSSSTISLKSTLDSFAAERTSVSSPAPKKIRRSMKCRRSVCSLNANPGDYVEFSTTLSYVPNDISPRQHRNCNEKENICVHLRGNQVRISGRITTLPRIFTVRNRIWRSETKFFFKQG